MRLSNGAWFFTYFSVFSALIFAYFSVFPIANTHQKNASNGVVTQEFSISDTIEPMPKEGLSSAPRTPNAKLVREENPSKNHPFSVVRKADDAKSIAYADLTERILSSPIIGKIAWEASVEIVNDRTEPRGKMHQEGVSILSTIPTESEYVKVLVHELGHVIDVNRLVAGAFSADPSEEFYSISWNSSWEKKENMAIADFVSGYALTNKYEDFAESFTQYVFHNSDFKKKAAKNESLARKYDFFSKNVFPDGDFQGTSFESEAIAEYVWDTTKIPIHTNKYLFFIR